MTSSTKEIADFIVANSYEQMPERAVIAAKKAILDGMGCALAGSVEPVSRTITEYVREMGGNPEATVIAGGFKVSAPQAALANGTMAHALDYDDTFAISTGYNMHPSAPILPAVFALGEKHKVSGRDTLTAYIVGIEVESRIGSAIGQKNSEAGWHPTAVLGTMAATAASANILKLSAIETQMALGIASSLAGGLMRNVGTMTKPMHAGNAARNGVVAAQLAKMGFTGNESIMEGETSFCSLFSNGSVGDLANKDSDLGAIWNIVSSGIAFKLYPSCRGTHPGIDAALHLRKEFNITADHVAAVICNASPRLAPILKFPRPKTGYEGKFSMQYCVATALLKGSVTLDDFTDEKVNDVEVQDFLSKISLVHPKDLTGEFELLVQEVVIKLENGKEYSCKVTKPKGEPENPMTDEELVAKFRECASFRLSDEKIESSLELISNLETVENIGELMKVVGTAERSGADAC